MPESTYLQPLLRNRENWKTRNILVLINPSQKQLDGDFFPVFVSRLRDPWRPGHHKFPEELQGLGEGVMGD